MAQFYVGLIPGLTGCEPEETPVPPTAIPTAQPTATPTLPPNTTLDKNIPPLPAPANVVNVSDVGQLVSALAGLQAGQTILLADGTYYLAGYEPLVIDEDNVSLRGASADPTKVILMGKGFENSDLEEEMIKLHAQNTTIAYLTMRDSRCNGLKLQSGANHNLLVHNVHFIDICERSIKGPHVPDSSNGIVRYCLFRQETPITSDIPGLKFDGDYIAGMDMMHIDGWKIHDNTFMNIRGMNGGGRVAVFLWQGSMNCITERNIFIGCDRSICYGNPSGDNDMTGGIIRNNFIYANGQGIEICHSTGVKIYNNTIYRDNASSNRTITMDTSSNVDIKNNIIFGGISGSGYTETNNLWQTSTAVASTWFVNHAAGNLHLKAGATSAIDKGVVLSDVVLDWDGEQRDGTPDIGADEYLH